MADKWSKVIQLKEGEITISEVVVNADNKTWDLAELNYIPSEKLQNRVNPHPVIEAVSSDALAPYVEAVPELYLSSLLDDDKISSSDKDKILNEILGKK